MSDVARGPRAVEAAHALAAAGDQALDVDADLTLTVDDVEADVRSTGSRLFVEFSTLAAAARLFQHVPPTDRRRADEFLRATDLAVEVRVRHRTVAVLGAGASPGVVAERLGVDPVELRVCETLSTFRGELSSFVRHVRRFGT